MAGYVGIDLGATHCQIAVTDTEGSIIAREDRPTPQGPTGEDITDAILDGVRNVCAEVGVSPTDLTAAGIGSIGPLDWDAGAVAMGVNIEEDVGQIPLRAPVAELIDGPVALRNDAVAGAIGERSILNSKPDHLVYITVSTGIGVGAIVDGHVLSGRDGNAGEMGHVVVDLEERLSCGCGGAGHWEAYCSGRNLPRFARLLATGTDSDLDLETLRAADLFANPADPLSERTLEEMTRYNAIGLAATIHAFAPEVVTIGGTVALENTERVIDAMRDRVTDHLAVKPPEVRPATLGADAVLHGAIRSALTEAGA